MLLFPKPARKKKEPKRLKRSRKPIAKRSVFRAHGDNPLKSYRRRFTDFQVMAKAEECRRERLADATPEEQAFDAVLRSHRVKFIREKIWLNGDRWICTDFFIPSVNLVIELDGGQHRLQKSYDDGRSMWLARKGVRVVRFWNAEVTNGEAEARVVQMLGLGSLA